MKYTKFRLAASLFVVAAFSGVASRAAEHGAAPAGTSPEQAISALHAGNDRYAHDQLSAKHYPAERHLLTKGQQPYAIVLSCSDSRVPPEILFDESLGKLFVVRVAGNVIDPVVLGSIEYAAEHLHTHLLIVLGHEGCGAVKATLDGGTPPPNIAELTKRIAPAVEKTKGKGMDAAVAENVRLQMEHALSESKLLSDLSAKGEIRILGAVYSLKSGTVQWLGTPPRGK
jgi:carbonic anhydrase